MLRIFRKQFKRLQHSVTETAPLGPFEDPEFHKAVIWFENVFPFKIPLFDPRMPYINSLRKQYEFDRKYEQLLPKSWPEGSAFKVIKAEPNLKEGGLYLEFKYKGGSTEEAIEHVKKYLKEANFRSLFNLGPVNAFEVKGRPWVEDLISRVPSRRLHVEFYGPDLTVEDIYREFRVFGKIVDITLQKSSDKETPRFASVQFLRKRAATSARNCIHGELFGQTRLAIGYEINQGWWYKVWHWVTANARISVLLLLAIIAGISYAVFDPWRVFSIRNKITGRFSFDRYAESASRWWHFFSNAFSTRSSSSKQLEPLHHWSEREGQTKALDTLLKQTPESSILVSGPKGSGKSGFVNDAIHSHPHKLKINCSELLGKGDYQLLSQLSTQVNFFPTFGFAGQISGLLDTLITASTGAKAGLATSSDNEVRKILDAVTLAVTSITEEQIAARNELRKNQAPDNRAADSITLPEIQYPIIIIDDFLTKETGHFLYDVLATWAGQLAEYRLAHVIFISDNPSLIQNINRITPAKTPEIFHLADANFDAAKSYVGKRLGNNYDMKRLLPYLSNLGGRFNDLDLFVSKIQSGLSPKIAFDDMIHRAVTELRRLGNLDEGNPSKNGWTSIQFWKIITILAQKPEVQFDEIISHPIFGSDASPVIQMERAGLINFVRKNERPFLLKPSRPLHVAAFQKMIEDSKLNSYMGFMTSKKLMADFTKKILEFEAELETLNKVMIDKRWLDSISLLSNPLETRRSWLISSIGTMHEKLAKEEKIGNKYRENLKLAE